MTGENRTKRKALHRGIEDILPNPDVDLTAKLLGRVTPPKESPAPDATLAQQTTVVQPATVALLNTDPLHDATVAQETTLAQYAINELQSTVTPNDIWDKIIPTLDVYDQSVLWQLYRLTRGYHRDTCTIGLPKLASRCNIGKRQVSTSVERLEKRGLIERLGADYSNKDKSLRGNIYRVNLPEGKLARRATVAYQAGDAQPATVASGAPMKTTTQKEITQTQVRGVSRFSLDECRAYADHLHKTGAGINSPRAFAASIYKTGNSDADIETFLNPPAQTDISRCPDCRGTGFIYIDTSNHDKGVRPCKHEPLKQAIE
jgi:DNA-binding Lrp family transcriptional regulator